MASGFNTNLDLLADSFQPLSRENDYDIDEKIARSLVFKVNLLSLNVIGKDIHFSEIFPGIEFTGERTMPVENLWRDERYQKALDTCLIQKYREHPKTFAWVPQRNDQLNTLLKSRISFQNINDQLAQELLVTEVPQVDFPSTAQILETVIQGKLTAFFNQSDENKWNEIFDLLSGVPVEVMGQLFELCFAKFDGRKNPIHGIEILVLLSTIIEQAFNVLNVDIKDYYETRKFINQILLSCKFNPNVHSGYVTDLMLYRTSDSIIPVLLRPFKSLEDESQLLLTFLVDQFINKSREEWTNKDKTLLNFLKLVSRSKGLEIVIRLIKEAKDEFTKQFATLLQRIYTADSYTAAYPILYELFRMSPNVNARTIYAIFGIPFKPYMAREIKNKNSNPLTFHLFYNTKFPILKQGSLLFGLHHYREKLTLVATNTVTKRLEWCQLVGKSITYFAITNNAIIVRTSDDNRIVFFDPITGSMLGSTYLPKAPDGVIPNSLHITDSNFCYFVFKENDELWLFGGQITKYKWKRSFGMKITSESVRPLGSYFAVEDPSKRTFTAYNPKGETSLIEDCSDIYLHENKQIISIHMDPKKPSCSILKISRAEQILQAESVMTLQYSDFKIIGVCVDDTIILYTKSQPTYIHFIDWKTSSTFADDISIPFDESSYIDSVNGAVWFLDHNKKNIIRYAKNKHSSLGSIEIKPGTKLVHVDQEGLLYYHH